MPRAVKGFRPPPVREVNWQNPATLQAAARLLAAQRAALRRYQDDPWCFLTECVQTLDQITGKTRRFPDHEYLKVVTRLWQAHKLLAIPKSRRMILTWHMVALHYWLARFHAGQKIAFMARKEGRNESEGSAELVWRAKFIHDHLPGLLPPVAMEYHFCRLTFPDLNSEILGIGEGADQVRQQTLSAIFGDEVGYWTAGYETYIGSRPTIEGGGRLTLVSSATPGFWKGLVFDQL